MIYLILFSSFFLTANAKTINRQAYKVCKSHEEAYWNGSSAECCDTSQKEYILVPNHVNGIGESGYACCEVKKNGSGYSGWTVVGAVNGSCCSGWTSYYNLSSPEPNVTIINSSSSDFQIRQNGGVYYCASDHRTTYIVDGQVIQDEETVYISDNKWCWGKPGAAYGYCITSDSGDPQHGEQYCSYPNCP